MLSRGRKKSKAAWLKEKRKRREKEIEMVALAETREGKKKRRDEKDGTMDLQC